METLFSAFAKAFGLIVHPTAELIWIVVLSLQVSGFALFLAVLVGLPLGALVGLKRFRLRSLVIP
jgi:tungstate transport system permease protein